MSDPLGMTMTNDEAQDFLASMCKPEDAGRLGAAIRGIRAKAIADAKAWYGLEAPSDPAAPLDAERLARLAFPGPSLDPWQKGWNAALLAATPPPKEADHE